MYTEAYTWRRLFGFPKSTLMTREPKRTAKGIETAAGLHRFDVAALRDVAGEKVFARGVPYHEGGQVEIFTFDKARVLARVIGSEVYRCELVGAGEKFSGECSCPAFSDWGFCKHLGGTALAAKSLGSGALEQVSSRFAKIREHRGARRNGCRPRRARSLVAEGTGAFCCRGHCRRQNAVCAIQEGYHRGHPHPRFCRISQDA